VSTFTFLFAAAVEAYVPEPKLLDLSIVRSLKNGTPPPQAPGAPIVPSSSAVPIGTSGGKINVNAVKNTVASKMTSSIVATNRAIQHKHHHWDKVAQVVNSEEEYWFDTRIHTFGNHGFMGAFHAAVAPISTMLIDHLAYDGVDVRNQVAKELSCVYHKEKAKVLDLCCGVGFSTRALINAFPDAEKIVGVDTSPQMLAMAKYINAHIGHLKPWYESIISQGRKIMDTQTQKMCSTITYKKGNAEHTTFQDGSFDVVTIMYAFHEAPKQGRQRIIQEVRRLLKSGGVLAVIDISADYTPSKTMLAGEPYVIEYQQNIHRQLEKQPGFARAEYKTLVPGHVGMWVLKRSSAL